MPTSISLADLSCLLEPPLLIDVRKNPARAASARTIPNALRGEPERVDEWGASLEGRTVVVFCVHGHEVSKGVADRLTELGVDSFFLDGGFAAWEAGGNPVEAIGAQA
ncbi:rhodanese-like domain-containing protein [Aquibium carbonis]|nr:rhodanese-like domain-containing protein [Aquibium carbonis]